MLHQDTCFNLQSSYPGSTTNLPVVIVKNCFFGFLESDKIYHDKSKNVKKMSKSF